MFWLWVGMFWVVAWVFLFFEGLGWLIRCLGCCGGLLAFGVVASVFVLFFRVWGGC